MISVQARSAKSAMHCCQYMCVNIEFEMDAMSTGTLSSDSMFMCESASD